MLRGVVGSQGGAEGREHVEPSLPPLNVEVGGEGDAVVLVVDPQDLVDVYGHAYHVCLFCGGKSLKDGIGIEKPVYGSSNFE